MNIWMDFIKKICCGLVCVVFLAICISFIACSDDDDDNGTDFEFVLDEIPLNVKSIKLVGQNGSAYEWKTAPGSLTLPSLGSYGILYVNYAELSDYDKENCIGYGYFPLGSTPFQVLLNGKIKEDSSNYYQAPYAEYIKIFLGSDSSWDTDDYPKDLVQLNNDSNLGGILMTYANPRARRALNAKNNRYELRFTAGDDITVTFANEPAKIEKSNLRLYNETGFSYIDVSGVGDNITFEMKQTLEIKDMDDKTVIDSSTGKEATYEQNIYPTVEGGSLYVCNTNTTVTITAKAFEGYSIKYHNFKADDESLSDIKESSGEYTFKVTSSDTNGGIINISGGETQKE